MNLPRAGILVLLPFLTMAAPAEQPLPARFEHNRVFVYATAPGGEEFRFYTDTGGGFNAVTESVTERLDVAKRGSTGAGDGEFELVEFPTFMETAGIPRPADETWLRGHLAIAPDGMLEADGFLGSRWFAGKIWKFDYPGKTLSLLESSEAPTGYQQVSLGFRTNDSGARELDFPRITIQVDGEALDMLLDTGATARLSESAAAEQGLPPGTRMGASYIIRSTFEQWRNRHPDWRVVEEGEVVTGQAFPMIQVPQVQIGGLSVGPVWFSVRPDGTFKSYMSQMMDKQIVGAVGGSMLQYLRMIIDYPEARAYFQRPSDVEQAENGG